MPIPNQLCPHCNVACPKDERGRCTHCNKNRNDPVVLNAKARPWTESEARSALDAAKLRLAADEGVI
jgi:hypothetical protein